MVPHCRVSSPADGGPPASHSHWCRMPPLPIGGRAREDKVAHRPVQFSDGSSYEWMMGAWSRRVGEVFLDWLRPDSQLDWLDVGCGSGSFTSLVAERCAPRSILGLDPSEAQLAFARGRNLGPVANFERGDVSNLGPPASFDVAVAALVVHFMPDPEQGVTEMARVVRPGGIVAAYGWDLLSGGFPYEAMHAAMRDLGLPPADPPHPEAGEADIMAGLWRGAGLSTVQQREIVVSRSFRDVEEYWNAATQAPRIAAVLDGAPADTVSELRSRVGKAVSASLGGGQALTARAHAISGRVTG